MNNEELESKLLLIKQSIDVLQEELAPHLKTKDLVLLRYGYNVEEIKKLNDYLFELTFNEDKVTKKEFKEVLCDIRELPEIPNRQVDDVLEGYRNSNLHVDVINNILNSDE
ncbi:hypothetical protein [Staphylococcus delphini]|uniref:Uncharacterized protein n=1 Tax=Staphylococcus delphini TaxID=53344 RepID=A0AAQ0D5Y4_9STAP|nr:hypothetical protein [Staphylococcus delphini]QUM66461.1 hypothetical protein IPU21_10070 [Staphylococcus delphini]QUM68898.1 hypothetical protein IPU22_10030 [Staphylococcus delphini]